MKYFYNGFDGFWGFHMIGGMILGIIFLIAFIALIVYIVNKLSHVYLQSKTASKQKEVDSEALRILNVRFANGEITEEEYERKKKLLMNG